MWKHIVGQSCGKFGGSGPTLECGWNKEVDITNPAIPKITTPNGLTI